MALADTILNQLRKNAEKNGGLQSSATDKIKSKAALIISIFAAIYSVNAFMSNSLNSKILNSTIESNDLYSFYQAKSIKQTMAEYAIDDALTRGDAKKAEELKAKVSRYESDPVSGEGKKELLEKAKKLDAERDIAKKKSPFMGIAGSIMQIAIVLLTASILSTGLLMFWAGLGAMGIALIIMGQGIFLWF